MKRTKDRHLPPCVYSKHGAYWYVKGGKWTPLGKSMPLALLEYAKLSQPNAGGMAGLIDRAMPVITEKLAPNSVKSYTSAANRLREVFKDFAPEQVRPKNVAALLDHHRHTPNAANMLRNVLKLVFDLALRWGLVDNNPVTPIKRLEEKKRDRVLTHEELTAIYAKASPALKCVIDLCTLTGQRIGDVIRIELRHISDDGITFRQEKTKKRLIVGWSPALRDAVAACKALTGNVRGLYLICKRNGRRYSYGGIYTAWQKACDEARIEDANIHDMRAFAITAADSQGLDAQKLAGHSSAAQTQDYIRRHTIEVVKPPSIRQRG